MGKKEVVEVVSKAINESGLSDKEIADQIGLSLQSVNRWRRKAVNGIRPANIRLLAEALEGVFIFLGDGSIKFHYAGKEHSQGETVFPSESRIRMHRDINIPKNYNLNDLKDEGLKELLTPINRYAHKITKDEEYDLITISLKNITNASITQWVAYLNALRNLKGS